MNSQDIESRGGLLRLEYDFGAATLTSITGYETLEMYSRGDIDGGFGAAFLGEGNFGPGFIPFASESADGLPELDQLTQEIRLASNGGGAVNWLAGFFYFDESLQADSFGYDSLAPGNPQDGYAYQKQDATAYALFGSLNWQVAESWNLTGGLRFSHDEKDFVAQRVQAPFVQWLFYGSLPTVEIPEHVEDDNVAWDLSAVYAVNENFNIYGRLATGFRAPSIQGRTLWCPDIDGTDPATNCVTVADTETILSFEAGIKTILAENRVRFNLNGYLFEMSDQQITAVGGEYNTEHRQDQGLRSRDRHPVDPDRQLADDLRRKLEPDRDRRSESDGPPVRWWLHSHRPGDRWPGLHRRQQPAARTGCGL